MANAIVLIATHIGEKEMVTVENLVAKLKELGGSAR